MATITKGQTFGATETITNAKLHLLVDAATVTGIVNADVSAGANIDSSKINLASSGYLTTGANFTITGVYTFTTSPVFSSVDINGGTIDGVVVGTIDINGGTMDGVQIGGTTATGELIVNNASDAADGLGSQGNSGQFLKSNGAGVNPSFATLPSSGLTSVSQGDLNTATGEVSISADMIASTNIVEIETLPGGTYGFYPQVKVSDAAGIQGGQWDTPANFTTESVAFSATTYYSRYVNRARVWNQKSGTGYVYAKQRYVTASGHDHWIFLKLATVDILIDGEIIHKKGDKIASYQAPDHPSANQGGATEIEIPHPFGSYDPTKHEIIVVDNADLTVMRQRVNRQKSLLQVVNEDYLIDDTKRPKYNPREIVKIDEYGDLPGTVIRKMKTPEWAKIMIGAPDFTLKRQMVEKLPNDILFKKMRSK